MRPVRLLLNLAVHLCLEDNSQLLKFNIVFIMNMSINIIKKPQNPYLS